jgi:hypothetical protein
MAIIRNDDMEMLIKVSDLLKDSEDTETVILFNDFLLRSQREKKATTERSNKYNKKNIEYHRATVNLACARRKGNKKLIKKWEKVMKGMKKK